jgi:hypothetical protein
MPSAKLNKTKKDKIVVSCVGFEDPTKMTQEEYYAKIDRALEQSRRGEVFDLKPEDISKFLGLE